MPRKDASAARATVQLQAETLLNNAKLDAKRILDEANAKAEAVLSKANNDADTLKSTPSAKRTSCVAKRRRPWWRNARPSIWN